MSNKGKEREHSPLVPAPPPVAMNGEVKAVEKQQQVWVLSDDEQELQLFFARKPATKLPKPSTSSHRPLSPHALAFRFP